MSDSNKDSNKSHDLQVTYQHQVDTSPKEKLDKLIADGLRILEPPGGELLVRMGLLPPEREEGQTCSSPEPSFSLLDNACGAGPIASRLIKGRGGPGGLGTNGCRIVCADANESMVERLKRRAEGEGWGDVVEAMVLDARDTGLPAASFSHVSCNFGMHAIPEPHRVLQGTLLTLRPGIDTFRLLRPGGIFGFSVMHKDNQGWSPDMRSGFAALPFKAPIPDPAPAVAHGQPQWADPEMLPAELTAAGFENVKACVLHHVVPVDGAEHWMGMFSMMRSWMVSAFWEEESKRIAEDMGWSAVDGLIIEHLNEKYAGKGWDTRWTMVLVTCRKPAGE